MLRLRQKHSVQPEAVQLIECDLKPYPLLRHHPRRGFEGRFSMPFCLAVALARGGLAPNAFTDDLVRDCTIKGLIHRTRHAPGAKELVVTLLDGTKITEELAPPSNLLSGEEIKTKFHNCADEVLSQHSATAVIEIVERLNSLASVRQLLQALRTKIR
jgi:2-methylcitrate dehydratase PrpD